MTTLLYRGHQYQQSNATEGKPAVQLVYRRNVYQARQINSHRTPVQRVYRGVGYTREGNFSIRSKRDNLVPQIEA